jgi:hypothetical protein
MRDRGKRAHTANARQCITENPFARLPLRVVIQMKPATATTTPEVGARGITPARPWLAHVDESSMGVAAAKLRHLGTDTIPRSCARHENDASLETTDAVAPGSERRDGQLDPRTS